mgnify:CR=1 FL=1|jgi:hypothetical protein
MIYNIFTTELATLIKLISSIDFVLVLVLLGYHFHHHTFFFLSSSSSSRLLLLLLLLLSASVLCLLTALTAFDDAQKNAQSTSAHKKNAHLH